MSEPVRGWLAGGLKQVLGGITQTHQPRPEGENVVDIPHGLEKLRRTIVSLQQALVAAQCERGDFVAAFGACHQEYMAAMEQNACKQRDIATRMVRLQSEWARVTEEMGLQVRLVPPPLDQSIGTIEVPYVVTREATSDAKD